MSAPELSVHNESRRAWLLGFASGGLLLAFGVPSLVRAATPVQPPVSANPQYGGAGCRTGCATIRTCSSRSRRTARSP